MENTVCYEHPLNERMRMFLRLDHLFRHFDYVYKGQSSWDTRAALGCLFDLLELISRNEMKAEIIKELDRHNRVFQRFQDSPGVNKEALESVCNEIQQTTKKIQQFSSLSLDSYRQQDFFNAIRQRNSIPGGTCAFDLPEFYHWLHSNDSDQRIDYLENWLQPIKPIQTGIYLILRLIRSSNAPRTKNVVGGTYQQTFEKDNNAPTVQLLRIIIDKALAIFPEVSGSQHRVSIRFMHQSKPTDKASLYGEPFDFSITCCAI